jgi:hypothetical protein
MVLVTLAMTLVVAAVMFLEKEDPIVYYGSY